MPLADGTKISGYRILRLLGSGGMGEVYLAQHPRLPRQDALKVLRADVSADPDYLERFNREADLVAKLWHPHIVGIHDRGKFRGRLWISMDYVDGSDVSRLLQTQYPAGMSLPMAVEIVKAVASALDYAHAQGLLHRDVKPANILVADVAHGERRILLSDFGVARDLTDSTAGGLTATNMTVGTAAYAAPEQLMGLPVDGRADQYSLAATAYHLLAGVTLFPHSNPAVVIGRHLNAMPPALADSRPELGSLDPALSRALAKVPDDRFRTCMDFARALEGSSVQPHASNFYVTNTRFAPTALARPPDIPPPSAPGPEPGSGRRTAMFAAGAATAVLAVVLVAYFGVRAVTKPPPAEPFTLAGNVRLVTDVKTSGRPGGYKCAGARDYADIGPDAPVTVEDEAGKLLAKGSIESSQNGQDSCLLQFSVSDVPAGAEFYRVQVAQQAKASYTESEAKAGVEVSVGNAEPSQMTTTTAPPQAAPPSAPTRTVTASPTPEVDAASLSQLRAIAGGDRAYVAAYLTDVWVPQISAKRDGLEADGVTWDNARILDQHLRMRQQYGAKGYDAKLLWSGDWSTYDGRDFWVTIVAAPFAQADDALAWCSAQGFDRDNCAAKIVSTTRPVAGSTKYNK